MTKNATWKNSLPFLWVCLLGWSGLTGQDSIAEKSGTIQQQPDLKEIASGISPLDMRKHLTVLASDAMEGRETGTPGNDRAAQYIADYFKELGLVSPTDKEYFQPVAFTKESWNEVSISIKEQKFKHLWDFVAPLNLQRGDGEMSFSEVLFLGYGIEDEKYSDFKDVDVTGKLLLVYSGIPRDRNEKNFSFLEESNVDWTETRNKVKLAMEKGAAGIFFIEPNINKMIQRQRRFLLGGMTRLGDTQNDKGIHFAHISTSMAEALIGKKYKKVIKARKKIAKKKKPYRVGLTTNLTLDFDKEYKKTLGNNVLGYVEGIDTGLKDKYIIVSAHYDHLGKRGDNVYNGADDNGSGTTTLLDIAESVVTAKKKGLGPQRSVVFVLFTGEEKGLLGSEYYVNRPVFPLDQTMANVNIDMVGRVDEAHKDNPDYIYVIGADRISTDLHNINERMNQSYTNLDLDYTYNAESDPNRYYYRSDHYNFASRGIPAIFYFNGTHADYHRTTDTVEKINFEKMSKVGQLIFYTIMELANREKDIIRDVPQK